MNVPCIQIMSSQKVPCGCHFHLETMLYADILQMTANQHQICASLRSGYSSICAPSWMCDYVTRKHIFFSNSKTERKITRDFPLYLNSFLSVIVYFFNLFTLTDCLFHRSARSVIGRSRFTDWCWFSFVFLVQLYIACGKAARSTATKRRWPLFSGISKMCWPFYVRPWRLFDKTRQLIVYENDWRFYSYLSIIDWISKATIGLDMCFFMFSFNTIVEFKSI